MNSSCDMSRQDPVFSVRIVVCDYYLAKPTPGIDVTYSDFRGKDIKQVPVLRIFGPTPGGRKACVHIHGVFPYFYIPCPTPNPEPQFLYQVAASLDKALNIALKQATSANQHVYKISLVKGLPFYGFHDREHLYLKVFLYSPGLIKQAVELCSNCAILGQPLQPHESHLSFTLQFFIDFNLFGMSNIDLQTVIFRKKGFSQSSIEPLESSNESVLKPESSCFYEADCGASHIINRQWVGKGDGIENPGLEEVWNQEIERRKQLNMSLASKSLSQGRVTAGETESHYKFEQMFLVKSSNQIEKPVIVNQDVTKPIEAIYYPAVSLEGSQLFNAVDVSVHMPDSTLSATMSKTLRRDLDESLIEDQDNTIVDESLALNSSLHYSQVLLNSEDLELVDMLEDMDEKPVEEDSVMGTPANPAKNNGFESDDAEYSKVYDDDTIFLKQNQSKDDSSESSPSWNDSFWDGANIPQLDGTFDDDHMSRQDPVFSVRIVVCDYYLAKPTPGIDVTYSDFRGKDIKQVPVLRIFGPTPGGRKACVHIHGVFPYFYIPCPTPNPEPQFLYQVAASLDKALNIALKQATSANQHVYKISLVKGLPFYGFHDREHLYLKVFLYSPGLIKQAVELCSNCAILGQPLQPHESHLSFTLQFFIDFNLFGMSNIDLQTVIFRKKGFSQSSIEPLESSNESVLKPESSCFYEADCGASHIINRQWVGKGDGIENPGLEEVRNQEIERRKQLNMSLASKSLSQGRVTAGETESHYKFEQMFLVKSSNQIEKPVIVNQDVTKPIEAIYYPAVSLEGSQLFNAVDVSVHMPDSTLSVTMSKTLRRDLDESLIEDQDNTIVDESLALNSSLHYSQVLLNSEDLELVDMLEDMDEKPVEEDSVMGTPANPAKNNGFESDDAEYSKVYDDDTIFLKQNQSKDDSSESSPSWNDSFWDGANIPQLDGTFDDDHVKKVRKRKMRPFKLGLSRPKTKKKENTKESQENIGSKMDSSETDEINASRDTIDDISDLHLRRAMKIEPKSILDSNDDNLNEEKQDSQIESMSILDLVHKATSGDNNLDFQPAQVYDLENDLKPVAGPSTHNNDKRILPQLIDDSITDSSQDTSQEENKGIMSFYASKVFDSSLDIDSSRVLSEDYPNKNFDKEEEKAIKNEINDTVVVHTDNVANFRIVKNNLNSLDDTKIKILTPKIKPPTKHYIMTSLKTYNIPKNIPRVVPYYSDYKDVGDKVEIGQILLKLHSKSAKDQKPFEKVLDTISIEEWRQLLFLQTNEMSQESAKPEALKALLAGNKSCVLEPIIRPPTRKKVIEWAESTNMKTEKVIEDKCLSKNIEEFENSQALGLHEDEINNSISLESNDKATTNLDNTLQVTMQPDGSFLCFGGSANLQETISIETPVVNVNFLTLMLIEVHTAIRRDLHPDPTLDAIQAIFVTVTNDSPPNHPLPKSVTEILVVDEMSPPKYLDRCIFNVNVNYINTESDLIEKVIGLVRKHDPDILCGYEIEMNSWGYLLERSQVLGLEIVKEISRITEKNRQKRWRSEENDFEGRIIGRVVFNVWRLFRHELALSSYSFENCMYEILKERVPTYSFAQLAEWWCDESRILRWIPVEYYLTRLSGTVRMLEKLDIINRTSELARLFGLQWWEVLSRGSQFRVESLMIRAARPLNLVALSPTVKQRAAMRAPECLPLIFEPESRFYTDPMIVLDFQSLYPSMMIAYNYCFSTCIGRIQNINGDTAYEFGAWRLKISKSKLDALVKQGLVHWSPVGVGFVKASVRRGVLPALLRRILAARQAVKKSMKMQTDESVKKAMHSRQLGLKLIANVTYGYTAANFSGRMPCVEVGDSVVAKGRETLERAIKLVRDNAQWNVKVVYGDTDSMFVLVPGATRAEAFEIGQQIADAVTADNPSPVALKLEKVYQPCILQTKKRYVGYMYESPDQEKPVYEAKGIETVRRDGCPAGVKLLQRALCELFETGDMSRVKRIVTSLLTQLVNETLPLQELFFTREYHGAAGYRPGATAPPNEIAKRIVARDRRAGPRAGWRVSWLVCAGAPAAALVARARSPREVARAAARPHVAYYAQRVLLPPLHRCLALLGADVFKWWTELGYSRESQLREVCRLGGIARYMSRERCALCGARGAALCAGCGAGRAAARGARARALRLYCDTICSSCCGHAHASSCENTECPVLWRRITAQQKLAQIRDLVTHLPNQHNTDTFDF